MLVLLVPLVVIPVVLLFGYAGCNQVFGLDPTTLNFTPINVEAEGESIESIRISWAKASSEPVTFKLFRITPGSEAEFTTDATEYLDTGLTPNTEYTYEVLAIRTDDFRESDRSESATGRTLDFMPAFSATLTTDQAGIGGFCLVQRIEPVRLVRSGSKVRLVLQGSTAGNLLIDRATISQVATGGNVYDSAVDLVEIATAVSIPAGQIVELPVVTYTLDQTKPLLVAFDISPTAGMGNVRFVNPVPATDASMHFRAATAEAGIQDRLPSAANPGAPPYNASTSIYLVQRIDVG
ncbi:fibronectin type III domain-containing protein [Roseimicrobium sp. ORNL1]|uniref:fibronectin type III domain-containing protein n=1 Tax=Roseimicrobium sp. ORNL1 TaxID=2711231 RepID=UPI0013E1D8B2|nr:fibronectin type III domain-containing protein [Roseimicrobium sp. ORNL1]QIF04536.1 fibronectin type III domain-containing protein [Roseimicrobium sp. ORNL1]